MVHSLSRSLLALMAVSLCTAGALAQTGQVRFAVTAPVANMHSAPFPDSDVVSQAIFGSEAILLESGDGWARVGTADDYQGWIRNCDLQRVGTRYGDRWKTAMVASLFASLYRVPDIEKHAPLMTVPFESRLEVIGEKDTPDGLFYSILLPGGSRAWVQAGDVTFDTKPLPVAAAIELARRFLGLPYRWGGTSTYGFDCSGFTQMLMRRRGLSMPRDTRPQARWDGLVPVERGDLQPGDILFFGKTPQKINHTAMYIGNGEFIHATRHDRPVVQISRLDDVPWTTQFITARRVK